jgi:cell division protein ZapB
MEIITQLEERFDKMLQKIKQLEEENAFLLEELEQEKQRKDEVRNRIESLLNKVEGNLE